MKPTWQTIGRQILETARNELYLNLPFLDAALCALPFNAGYDTLSLATDTKVLYYNGAWLASRYARTRSLVCRAYLHTILHCMLRHPVKKKGRNGALWDLCCDIAVESILDSLSYRCLEPDTPRVSRRLYHMLKAAFPVLTAEAIYRYFGKIRCRNMTVQHGQKNFYRTTIACGKRHSRSRHRKTHGRVLLSGCRRVCKPL